MIEREELPIGFTMELAMHPDALNHFSGLSKAEQDSIVEGSKKCKQQR